MNIIYKRLFNLILGHDYFVDGFDRFVHLVPTVETSQLLKNGKMLFKRLPHGIAVLYRANDDEVTPMVDLEKNQKFVFTLKVNNLAGFLAISNLNESVSRAYQSGNIIIYRNNPGAASASSNNPEIITHEIIDTLRPALFSYSFIISGNPASVKMRVADADGNLVSVGAETDGTLFQTTLSVNINSNNTYNQQVDLQKKKKGKYTITILDDSELTILKTEEIYIDNRLLSEKILGLVEIVYDSGTNHLYGSTEEYRIQFAREDTFWKYFVVNKSRIIDFSSESLKLVDSGVVNGTPYSVNQFERVFAGILLTADSDGEGGNLITLEYAGAGEGTTIRFSGDTLSGGKAGVNATGTITLTDNSVTGYTITIGGVSLTEGTDFTKGSTAAATATALASAINSNGSIAVSATVQTFDTVVNDLQTLVFVSNQEIPFYEKPKLNLELQQTSDDQVIVANMPNPSHSGNKKFFANREESEVYVFI